MQFTLNNVHIDIYIHTYTFMYTEIYIDIYTHIHSCIIQYNIHNGNLCETRYNMGRVDLELTVILEGLTV